MSTDLHSEPPTNHPTEAANELASRASEAVNESAKLVAVTAKNATGAVKDVAGDITDTIKDVTNRATETAKDMYQSAALKAGDTLETSKEYVRQNPVPVVIGAIAFGAVVGSMLILARRKPTFGERYADDPMVAIREAIRNALAPVSQRVHEGYDSARDGAEKVLDRAHSLGIGRRSNAFSNQIGRIGSNLKFW